MLLIRLLWPSESIEVDPTPRVELDPLGLQECSLKPLEPAPARAGTHLTPGVDHAMPREVFPVRQGGERVPDLPGTSREPGFAGNRPVRRDPSARDAPHDLVDESVRAHGGG